jgi:hypothetical protein
MKLQRFNDLPERHQIALSLAAKHLAATAPKQLLMPVVPASEWRFALSVLNVKLNPNLTPLSSEMSRVVDHLTFFHSAACTCFDCSLTN